MSNNYPPGVTGNEPQITGQVEYDPHAPFWVGGAPEESGRWAVYYADSEDLTFLADDGGWTQQDHAQHFADRLNSKWAFRDEDRDPNQGGRCRVCGDWH